MTILAANRGYPSLPNVSGDVASHTAALRAIIESLNVARRRKGDIRDSFVRVGELEDLGFIRLNGNVATAVVSEFDTGSLAPVATTGDHGDLTGLGDDDHTQYILASGSRPFTGTQQTRLLQPTADDSFDLGTTAARYGTIFATAARVVKGTGTVTVANNGSVVGFLGATSTGVASIVSNPGVANSFSLALGASYTTGAGNTTLSASGVAAAAVGAVLASSTGSASLVASGRGSSAAGLAESQTSATADIIASLDGAYAQGSAVASSGALARIRASGLGSFAQGSVNSSGVTSFIDAASLGAFAQGSAFLGTINVTGGGAFGQGSVVNGNIVVSANGGFAQGFAQVGNITTSGTGGFSHGFAFLNGITASGFGSFAVGYSFNGAIEATNENSFQFGVGTNSVGDSLQVGNALHFRGVVGAFPSPANGQMWRGGTSNAYVLVRSNGANVQLGPVNTWTTGAHATLRDFTGTTTAAQALQLIETLVEDLRTANII